MYKVMNKKLFVGIDFSKETFDAAILKVSDDSSIDLKIIGNEQFKNDVLGCKRFVKWPLENQTVDFRLMQTSGNMLQKLLGDIGF